MVIDRGQRSAKKPVKQGRGEDPPEPTKINACTRFDFAGKNLTAYGGLLLVATAGCENRVGARHLRCQFNPNN
jgi:hypothetical protein